MAYSIRGVEKRTVKNRKKALTGGEMHTVSIETMASRCGKQHLRRCGKAHLILKAEGNGFS